MSRASKIFFAGSCALTAGTIWAVHHIQVTEQAVSLLESNALYTTI
jgi:hypothetical protein